MCKIKMVTVIQRGLKQSFLKIEYLVVLHTGVHRAQASATFSPSSMRFLWHVPAGKESFSKELPPVTDPKSYRKGGMSTLKENKMQVLISLCYTNH